MKHIIIIPTYNEYNNIERIIDEIFRLYVDSCILIVDDSSPDNTAELVLSLQKKYKKLFLLSQTSKGGIAKAYINGFKWAINNGFDVFTTCDADFSHNPKYIKTALDYINSGFDGASGSRFIKNGGTDEKNWFRNLLSVGGNIYSRFILGANFCDWLEGFNTYTLSALNKINLDSIGANGFIFGAEMKYRALKAGCSLKEFPILFSVRTKGKSKMDINIILEAFFQVIKLRLSV